MAQPTVLIVNPRSRLGHTGAHWSAFERTIRTGLADVTVRFTEAAGHATALARTALLEGAALVVAVGGDGTNNEVVNGFFDDAGQPLRPDARFAFLATGTGSDLGRTLGYPADLGARARHIATAPVRRIDLGRAHLTDSDGRPAARWFINIASFGVSGEVVRRVNARKRGGALAYGLSTAQAILGYRNSPVTLTIDGQPHEVAALTQCAVANGQFFGGGMHIAPGARLDDGLFDIVVAEGWSPVRFLLNASRVYAGTHLALPGVRVLHGRKVELECRGPGPMQVETDGELPGTTPASFELHPRALLLQG